MTTVMTIAATIMVITTVTVIDVFRAPAQKCCAGAILQAGEIVYAILGQTCFYSISDSRHN